MFARAAFLRWGNPGKTMIGLNCMHPFGFGVSSGGAYTYTGNGPFTNGGTDAVCMPPDRLAKIKFVGFDFVRMAVDPGVLAAAASDSVLDTLNNQIVAACLTRITAGLKVIVDIHVNSSHPVSGWSYTDFVDGPSGVKMTRLKYVVARLARAMWAARTTSCPPSHVCIELYNEPPTEATFVTATYNTQIKDYYDAIRAVCGYTLIVGGSNVNAKDGTAAGDGASGLTHLDPTQFDGNTAFAFHDYEPFVFTHQGVSGTIYHCMHGLTFPLTDYPGGQAAAETAFTSRANAEGHSSNINPVVTQTGWWSSINKAFTDQATKTMMATRLAVCTAWADSNSVNRRRVFDTEGGVNFRAADSIGVSGDATTAYAAAWLQARRENAVAAGIGCVCVHEMQYTSSDFGIQDSTTPWDFDATILAGAIG